MKDKTISVTERVMRTHTALILPEPEMHETQGSLQRRVNYLQALLMSMEARLHELDGKTPVITNTTSGRGIRNTAKFTTQRDGTFEF